MMSVSLFPVWAGFGSQKLQRILSKKCQIDLVNLASIING